ncbi:hypothetical protein L3Q82_004803 [Scortum barcoo]|uniref:Uncharacterized protein n=1 Tax=Scortum barcoo TaxID=214431 RepID=A0ACB8VH54_9TELE|nr:hypothetical protein L3Q82_004803 [Scortum barcoo]
MVNINIGTININGACSDVKRASLFKLCELKKLNVLFVQETHSDSNNERDWRREWPGQVFLSHKQSSSAGVGILFSRAFSPQSLESCTTSCLVMLSWSKHCMKSLESRNGQRKVIHCLRSDNGSSLTDATEIRRRAVITLLPKKGDLQDLKNWRPVSLLCGDYKVLSKALALRLREVMAEVVHVDQTYCVPGRLCCFSLKKMGGQGLVHLSSRCAAFRLQFIQRLLYGPQDLVWRPLAQLTLQSVGDLRLQESVFLMDFKTVNFFSLPVFYRGLFSMWKLLWRQRVRHESLVLAAAGTNGSWRPPECPLLGTATLESSPGLGYNKTQKDKCQMMNFILGQSKMAVYMSRKRKVEDGVDSDIVLLLSKMIKARVLIDFNYYREIVVD